MRVVLYLRLSDEDHDKLTSEELSKSIKNQETMLTNYALENNWQIVGIYQDEDYSGADRDRPNFNKMIMECKKGNVDIVLVKTQSRFARDIELIDKYVHNLFYEWNVRFLTYLEKIDNTKKETKKASQITSMVDEWYIEDTSLNIRATLKAKRENGEFTGSFAPYGYLKDPNNKNHLVIDKVVAPIIKKIYKQYLNGYSLMKIVQLLNQENILSPLEYKRLNGSKLQIPLTKRLENYPSIKQTGHYQLNVFYCHDKKEPIKDLVTYQTLSIPNNTLEFTLKNYTESLDFYYTTNLQKEWIKIKKNETITNVNSIIICTKEIQYKQTIFYQLDIELKENKKQFEYYFLFQHYKNKKLCTINFDFKIRKKYKWSIQTIKNILSNEFYIGNLVQFKSTHVSYKNHTVIHNDKSKWIYANNTHEAIIDKNTWNKVQKKLKEHSRSTKTGNIHPLSNKVFCLECNKSFMKCGKSDSSGYSYLCCRDKLEKWKNCNNHHYLNEKIIHTFLLKIINKTIQTYFDIEEWNILKNNAHKSVSNSKEEKEFLLNQLQEKNNYFTKLYESYSKNILNEEEFLNLKTKYQLEIETIKKRLTAIEETNHPLKEFKISTIPVLKQLDSLFINTFIDTIFIGTVKENTRRIEIVWNIENYSKTLS